MSTHPGFNGNGKLLDEDFAEKIRQSTMRPAADRIVRRWLQLS